MDFEGLYNEIMNLDPNVRFVVVLNRNGERIYGGYRENLKHFLTPDELNMVIYHACQRWEGRKHLAHKIGKALYSMTEYEKVKRISFPIDENYKIISKDSVSLNYASFLIISAVNSEVVLFPPMSLVLEPDFTTS